MPFDSIHVNMKLKKLYERGMDLYFEYHKVDPSGRKEKIAYGDHTLAWVHIDDHGGYMPRDLPELYVHAMLNNHGTGHG
jgi:hypothetical protein